MSHHISQSNIQTLITDARKNPDLLSTLDIDALLDSTEIDDAEYLECATLKTVRDDVLTAICELPISRTIQESFCRSLAEYRLVDQLCDLRVNRFSRWIYKEKPGVLYKGGTTVDIKILNNIQVLSRTFSPRFPFVTCIFDDKIVFFQKLVADEVLILMSNEYLDQDEPV